MLKKLAPYTRGYRWYILLGVLCSVGESVLELELPRAMSEIVDVAVRRGCGGAGRQGGHGFRRQPAPGGV